MHKGRKAPRGGACSRQGGGFTHVLPSPPSQLQIGRDGQLRPLHVFRFVGDSESSAVSVLKRNDTQGPAGVLWGSCAA